MIETRNRFEDEHGDDCGKVDPKADSQDNEKSFGNKDHLAKFDKNDDISTEKSKSSRKQGYRKELAKARKSKSNQQLGDKLSCDQKTENLIGMVRDMATFKWPNSLQDENKQMTTELGAINKNFKQIKFEGIYFKKSSLVNR